MKAAMLTGLRQLEVRDTPNPPQPTGKDVLIRMAVVGVCGSDIHYYTSGRIGSQIVEYPFTVGHEGAGVVEAVGPEVTRVRPGDRIAVEPAVSCGSCDQCLSDRANTCRALRFTGCPGQLPGCLSEYLLMPESSCFPIAEGMTLTQAALSEPLAIGVYSVRLAGSLQGKRIGILGAGPIGLSVLAAARADGADAVTMTDRLDERLDVARSAGAAWAGNPDAEDVVRAILSAEPLGLDAVFECCGQQEALDQALQVLKPGGSLLLVGIPESDRISFNIDLLRRKEIRVQNVRRQNESVQATLDGMADGTLDVDYMVTHRFPLERVREAFDLVAGYRDGVVKAMIHLSPDAD